MHSSSPPSLSSPCAVQFVLFLGYMAIISSSLRALDCTAPIGGVSYVRTDLDIPCGVGQHAVATAIAYIVLALVGLGFPALLFRLLVTATKEQLADGAFRGAWGFLYDGYRTHRAGAAAATPSSAATPLPPALTSFRERLRQRQLQWWEAVVLLRKAGIALLAVLVTDAYMQSMGATLLLAAAGALQLHFRPYAASLFNWLELLSLCSALCTAVISTTLLKWGAGSADFGTRDAYTMSSGEWAITITLAVLNLGSLSVMAAAVLRLNLQRAQDRLQAWKNQRKQRKVLGTASAGSIPGGGGSAGDDTGAKTMIANPLAGRSLSRGRASMRTVVPGGMAESLAAALASSRPVEVDDPVGADKAPPASPWTGGGGTGIAHVNPMLRAAGTHAGALAADGIDPDTGLAADVDDDDNDDDGDAARVASANPMLVGAAPRASATRRVMSDRDAAEGGPGESAGAMAARFAFAAAAVGPRVRQGGAAGSGTGAMPKAANRRGTMMAAPVPTSVRRMGVTASTSGSSDDGK